MAITFVQAGRHFVNLETVTSVELVESAKKPDEIVAVRVHFSTGKHQDFKGPDEIEQLKLFLEMHRAK